MQIQTQIPTCIMHLPKTLQSEDTLNCFEHQNTQLEIRQYQSIIRQNIPHLVRNNNTKQVSCYSGKTLIIIKAELPRIVFIKTASTHKIFASKTDTIRVGTSQNIGRVYRALTGNTDLRNTSIQQVLDILVTLIQILISVH